MLAKGVALISKSFFCLLVCLCLQGISGRTSYDIAPAHRENIKGSVNERIDSSTINESQLTTGSVSGFVNSTAEGNGQPNSAVAYAWQGGQTSAHGSQTAIAENSNATAQTTGFSTCQQGYLGNAGGSNSTAANSVGNALCNATYNQTGEHSAEDSERYLGKGKGNGNGKGNGKGNGNNGKGNGKGNGQSSNNGKGNGQNNSGKGNGQNNNNGKGNGQSNSGKGNGHNNGNNKPQQAQTQAPPPMVPQMPQFAPQAPMSPPQVVTLNYTVGQTGEAQSGQTHNSISNAGGPTGGLLNILAGGFANMPQGSMTFQHSVMDPQGQPIQAVQDLVTDPGLASEEQTLIAVSGGQVGHLSGGLAHVYGLGQSHNTSYNSLAPEGENKPKRTMEFTLETK